MNIYLLRAVGVLAGTIIGAGMFSLPYVFRQVGMGVGIFYLVFFFAVYAVVHGMYAELICREKGKHEFYALAKKFLSFFAPAIVPLLFFELFFTLVVYLTLAPTFFGMMGGVSSYVAVLFFWLLSSGFLFLRSSAFSWFDFFCVFGILFVVAFLFFSGLCAPARNIVSEPFSFPLLFLPLGPLLFAFAGRPAISRVLDIYLKATSLRRRFRLRSALFLDTLIPAVLYVVFVFGMLRFSPDVTEDAFSSLHFLPPLTLWFLGLLGIITILTSYVAIGINIREVFSEDLRVPRFPSAFLVIGIPLFLYLVGFNAFFRVISITGGLFLALEGSLIVFMWLRAFPRHAYRWAGIPLFLVFGASFLYQIYSLF